MTKQTLIWTSLTTLVLATGCVTEDANDTGDAEDLGEVEQDIHSGGSAASEWQWRRAVAMTASGTRSSRYCTGTLVGTRHVLTAAHCNPYVGDRVLFYTSGVLPDEASDRVVDAVYLPSGVNPATDDLTDSNGKFADMALVRLASNAPSTSIVATMAWTYPAGGDDVGYKVGAGQHDSASNPDADLMQIRDWTYSDSDGDGHFLTENEQTNPGDSGGPFFHGLRVLGVLYGDVFEWEIRNKYTSTPYRLSWVLSRMNYTWSGDAEVSGRRYTGTAIETFGGSRTECQYACERTGNCVGFTHRANYASCTTYSQITGSVADSYAISATK